LKETNLFRYATSELSQDAFICWLLSHAKIGNQNQNLELTKCAIDVLRSIPQLSNVNDITEIQWQYSVGNVRIDILLTVDDYKVIIEDKIFSEATDSQIQAQKNALISEGVSEDKINSDIFTDYVDYLENFNQEENLYNTWPIAEWWSMPYTGFFKHLIDRKAVSQENWWGYVPNPSGGFMCLCWYPLNNAELDQIGLTEDYCDECKLQIENNKIAVKISADGEAYDKIKVNHARQKILEYFQKSIPDFEKPARQVFSTWMTVGYIYYDEKNYAEKIKLMNNVFIGMKTNFKLNPIS